MKNSRLPLFALLHALGTILYVGLVATVISHGERWFGRASGIAGPVAILMLFVLSATIVGTLVLGRPIWLYFEGKKKEALSFFAYTVGFLVLATSALFLGLALWA